MGTTRLFASSSLSLCLNCSLLEQHAPIPISGAAAAAIGCPKSSRMPTALPPLHGLFRTPIHAPGSPASRRPCCRRVADRRRQRATAPTEVRTALQASTSRQQAKKQQEAKDIVTSTETVSATAQVRSLEISQQESAHLHRLQARRQLALDHGTQDHRRRISAEGRAESLLEQEERGRQDQQRNTTCCCQGPSY